MKQNSAPSEAMRAYAPDETHKTKPEKRGHSRKQRHDNFSVLPPLIESKYISPPIFFAFASYNFRSPSFKQQKRIESGTHWPLTLTPYNLFFVLFLSIH